MAGEQNPGLRSSFDSSVVANAQLVGDLDDALVAAGRAIADRVDAAVASGDGEELGKALYLVPHLMNVLREMYATPKSRRDAGVEVEVKRDALADIRDIRGRRAPTKKRDAS